MQSSRGRKRRKKKKEKGSEQYWLRPVYRSYAVDGRIYMTLSGPDGLFLFGATDPSVIPEPSTLVLAGLLVGLCGWRTWRRGRLGEGS